MPALRSTFLAGAALCAAGAATPAAASFIAVTNLNAATNGHVTFANLNDPVGTTYAPGTTATYSSAGGSISVLSSSNVLERNDQNSYIDSNFAMTDEFISQCGYSGAFSCNGSGAVRISFALPTVGFTVSADDFDTSQPYTFTATAFNGSTVLGTVTATSLADNGSSPAVLAALSSVPITAVTITDPTGNFALAEIGTVPEPASMVLLATGLLGVAGMRRRRG